MAARTVLIVDPCPLERGMIAIALQSAGMRTQEAKGGLRALKILEDFRIDLIVAQAQMPDLSGIELTRYVKSDPRLAKIPILLRSSRPASGLRKEALEAGAADLRSCQEAVDPLIVRIRTLLQEQRSTSQRAVILRTSPGRKMHIRAALQKAGFRILDVGDPSQVAPAIEELDSLDFAFVDFRLSSRQAVSFIRYVRDLSPSRELRVVLLMSGSDVEEVIQGVDGGVDHYRLAPVTRKEVYESLRTLGLWKTVER